MRCVVGIDLGSTTTKAVLLDERGRRARPRHHQQPQQLRGRVRGRARGGAARGAVQPARARHRRARGRGRRRGARAGPAAARGASGSSSTSTSSPSCADAVMRHLAHPARGVRCGHARARRARRARRRWWRRRRRLFLGGGAAQERLLPRPRGGRVHGRRRARRPRRDVPFEPPGRPVRPRHPRRRDAAPAPAIHARAAAPRDRAHRPRRATAHGRPRARASRSTLRDPPSRIDEVSFVGTGYGRQTLPFPKEAVRSEILCHGRGAHRIFPGTRTVLDIGGQDTKAIQVDEQGVVTSFQMNDRCAAGCGRYLGYIADELNLGLHELGPLALRRARWSRSTRPARCSPAPSCASGSALGERPRGHPRRPAPRDHAARDVAARALGRRRRTSSRSPAASARTRWRPCSRELVRRELRRRTSRSTSTPTPSTWARSAPRCSRSTTCAPGVPGSCPTSDAPPIRPPRSRRAAAANPPPGSSGLTRMDKGDSMPDKHCSRSSPPASTPARAPSRSRSCAAPRRRRRRGPRDRVAAHPAPQRARRGHAPRLRRGLRARGRGPGGLRLHREHRRRRRRAASAPATSTA